MELKIKKHHVIVTEEAFRDLDSWEEIKDCLNSNQYQLDGIRTQNHFDVLEGITENYRIEKLDSFSVRSVVSDKSIGYLEDNKDKASIEFYINIAEEEFKIWDNLNGFYEHLLDDLDYKEREKLEYFKKNLNRYLSLK